MSIPEIIIIGLASFALAVLIVAMREDDDGEDGNYPPSSSAST